MTIKEVFGNGFLDIAAKGAENYTIAQAEELDKMKEVENLIKDVQKEYGDLVSPEILIEGELSNDTYKGIVTVTIKDKLKEPATKAEKIKYVINGEEKYLNGTNNSFTVEGDGTYEVVAYMVDKNDNLSAPSEIEIFTIKNNIAPRWAEGGEPHLVEKEKTDIKIKLAMTAIDDDGDNLTYTIKYHTCNGDGTKGDYIGEKKIENVVQGEEQEVDITGLSNYTKYWFEVKVTDEKDDQVVNECTGTTYCKASRCSGGGTTTRTCGSCGGSGGRSSTCSTCGGKGYWLSDNIPDRNIQHLPLIKCSPCGASGKIWTNCSSCGGSGEKSSSYNCGHGYYGSHYYCSEHGKNVNQYHM